MSIYRPYRQSLARGATLDIAGRIPDGFADGYFAGWVPTSQLRTYADVLIDTLDAQWVDAADTRYIRLRAAELGVAVSFEEARPGTCVRFMFPVHPAAGADRSIGR